MVKIIRYYFNDVRKIEDFDFDHILLDKNHENILIYEISQKTLIGAKPVYIMFDKVDRFNRVHDGTLINSF